MPYFWLLRCKYLLELVAGIFLAVEAGEEEGISSAVEAGQEGFSLVEVVEVVAEALVRCGAIRLCSSNAINLRQASA